MDAFSLLENVSKKHSSQKNDSVWESAQIYICYRVAIRHHVPLEQLLEL